MEPRIEVSLSRDCATLCNTHLLTLIHLCITYAQRVNMVGEFVDAVLSRRNY